MRVHARDTVCAQSGNVPAPAYTHSGSRHTSQASQAPVLYYKQKGSGGWVTKMDASSARKQPHATQARTRAGHSVNGTIRVPPGYRKSVKGCPSLNSYRSGTPRIEVCASASLRRHRLGTVQAPHHRHRHPARAPMLPALSCSCKPANVRRARYVATVLTYNSSAFEREAGPRGE